MFLEPEVELPIATAALIGVVWLLIKFITEGGKGNDL